MCDIVITSPLSDVKCRHNKPHVAWDDDKAEIITLLLEECRLQGVRKLAVNANVSG